MKVREIVTMYNNLIGLSNKKLPVKLSYAISRNLSMLREEMTDYEKQRIRLCEDASEKEPDGKAIIEDGKYKVDPDKKDQLSQDMEELIDEDIEIDLHKVNADILDKLEEERYDPLTASDLSALEAMIEG